MVGRLALPILTVWQRMACDLRNFIIIPYVYPREPLCSPGLYSQQVGVFANSPKVYENCVTLAEVLKTAGYRTLMTGKWHAQEIPTRRGFDRYFGLCDGCCNFFNPGPRRPGEPEPGRKLTSFGYPRRWAVDDKEYQPYSAKEKDFYTTDAFTDHALGYLDLYGKGNNLSFYTWLIRPLITHYMPGLRISQNIGVNIKLAG